MTEYFLYVSKCHLCDWELCASTSTLTSGECAPYVNIWVECSNLRSHAFKCLLDLLTVFCDSRET